MKQTAVEWLQQALEDTILDHEQIMQTIGLFEQAKEMEKEQIKDAFIVRYTGTDEEYYNETYNTTER
jgi:hypothetical protein